MPPAKPAVKLRQEDPWRANEEARRRQLREGGRLLAADAIGTFLRTGDRTLVRTELGEVDVLQGLPQVPTYSRASERPRDRDDLEALEAAQEEGPAED